MGPKSNDSALIRYRKGHTKGRERPIEKRGRVLNYIAKGLAMPVATKSWKMQRRTLPKRESGSADTLTLKFQPSEP